VNPALTPAERVKNFREVEMSLPENSAREESRRCLRCDLAFTEEKSAAMPGQAAMEGA
jgi:NADPH-dependent glutamate synthase beta subunit-like oxidoreductase